MALLSHFEDRSSSMEFGENSHHFWLLASGTRLNLLLKPLLSSAGSKVHFGSGVREGIKCGCLRGSQDNHEVHIARGRTDDKLKLLITGQTTWKYKVGDELETM